MKLQDESTAIFTRWFFLSLFCFSMITTSFLVVGFGQVSDIYRLYLDRSYADIDWLALIQVTAGVVTAPVSAFLASANLIKLRNLAIVASLFTSIACFSVLALSFDSGGYTIAVIGLFFNGVSMVVYRIIRPAFSFIWFPEHRTGTVIAVQMVASNVGLLLGYLVPSVVLPQPPESLNSSSVNITTGAWFNETSKDMLWMYSTLLVSVVTATILISIFVTDLPVEPPTLAQAVKRKLKPEDVSLSSTGVNFMEQSWKLMTDKTFILTSTIGAITLQTFRVETLMLSEIIHTDFGDTVSIFSNLNVLSGILMTIAMVGQMLGASLGGFLMDCLGNHKLQCIFGLISTVASSLIVVLGYCDKYWVVMLVGQFLYGIFTRFLNVAIHKVLMEHTYPTEELFVSSWGLAIESIVGVPIPLVGRWVHDDINDGPGVLIYMSGLHVIAALMGFFIKPKNHDMSHFDLDNNLHLPAKKKYDERTRLLSCPNP